MEVCSVALCSPISNPFRWSSCTQARYACSAHVPPWSEGVPEPLIGHTPLVVRNPRSARRAYTSRPASRICESGSSKIVKANDFPSGHLDPCSCNDFTGRSSPGHPFELVEIVANRHGESEQSLQCLARRREGYGNGSWRYRNAIRQTGEFLI